MYNRNCRFINTPKLTEISCRFPLKDTFSESFLSNFSDIIPKQNREGKFTLLLPVFRLIDLFSIND